MQKAKEHLLTGEGLPKDHCLYCIKNQLCVVEDVVYRSIKLVPNDVAKAPVIPESLQDEAVAAVHLRTGHAGWDTMWQVLREECFFTGMADACRKYVHGCTSCLKANPRSADRPHPTRPVSMGGPWEVVQLDTLELGVNRSGKYHCVLVAVDMFTKWVEVQPLARHDANSVVVTFVNMCSDFGAPKLVRCDNGTEFRNAVVEALFDAFGVEVAHGAVRHPRSQGAVERFNQTLLSLIRKVLDSSDDCQLDLDMLLFYYRSRPHSSIGISPMRAMYGWSPRGLVVDRPRPQHDIGSWVADLHRRSAGIREHLEESAARMDFTTKPSPRYSGGEKVLLRRPARAVRSVIHRLSLVGLW